MRTDPKSGDADVDVLWQTGSDHGSIELSNVDQFQLRGMLETLTEYAHRRMNDTERYTCSFTGKQIEQLKRILRIHVDSVWQMQAQAIKMFGDASASFTELGKEAGEVYDLTTQVYRALPADVHEIKFD